MKTDKIDISVIIPVYNPGKYLIECLESVVNQDFTGNYEIILIDDGSTDKSPEICRKYAQKHNNITVITQKNGGQSKARNEGLKIANGEYITFVDSDDYIFKNSLSSLFTPLKERDADIALGGFTTLGYGISTHDYSLDSSYCNKALPPEQFFYAMSKNTVLFSSTIMSKLIRKSIFDDNEIYFPEKRLYEDMAIFTKIYAKAKSYVLIPDIIYSYNKNVESSTTCNSYRSISTKDINDYFSAALDVLNEPIKTATSEARNKYKRNIAGSSLVMYAEYQQKALEALSLSDGLEKEYIFFGASVWAEKYLKFLKGRNVSVVLSDNDKNKHNKEMYGCRVIPPEQILNDENRGKRILISSMYFMEIYKQLRELGAVKGLTDLMPYNGKTDTEKIYAKWIKLLEPFWD